MPEGEFARQEEELKAKLAEKTVGWRTIIRDIFGSARELKCDKQGRILLPEEFCKAVALTANTVFVGVKNSFEIWDAAKRSSAAEQEKQNLPQEAAALLDDMGL